LYCIHNYFGKITVASTEEPLPMAHFPPKVSIKVKSAAAIEEAANRRRLVAVGI